jgi:response regulator of citrate/malate metabolism
MDNYYSFDWAIKNISKEIFKDVYYNNSFTDAWHKLNISKHTLDKLVVYFKLEHKHKTTDDLSTYIDLNNFKEYYNVHTYDETREHFNLSKVSIDKYIKNNNISKRQYLTRLNIDKNIFIDFCNNHTDKETELKFNISNKLLCKLKHEYNILKNTSYNSIKNLIDCSSLERYYIIDDHSNKETAKHFNTTGSNITRLCVDYGLDKQTYYRNKIQDYLLKHNNEKYSIKQLANILNMSESCVVHNVTETQLRDHINYEPHYYEQELSELLGPSFIKNRTMLDGLEIDFYNETLKLGIEFNGDYWHSDIFKDKYYHQNKSKLAETKGIRLIHIWEHEWLDPRVKTILFSMLNIAENKAKQKIYARQCSIKQITNNEARPFNNKNHLQGHRNAQVTYGLFYNNELVQLMSFSRTRWNRNLKNNDAWEIIRGCPGSNNVVVGGVSKLFTHFVKDYNPSSVFSYCDFNKFDGKGYEALGMKFIGYTEPDMKWFMKDRTVMNRQPSRYKELKANSLAQIWGAGSKKYLWTNPNKIV